MRIRVLVGCEESGLLRDALVARGIDAYSCDILPRSHPRHITGDVLRHLDDGWHGLIAFPPCTHLSCSGARYFAAKRADGRQQAAVDFFMSLVDAPIDMIGVENPVGIMSTHYRKPDQIIQPWQFGHPESKATCLWLKNLPPLVPTKIMEPDGTDYRDATGKRLARWANQTGSGQNRLGPSPDRAMIRARTYQGIADAMAEQWGRHMEASHGTH